jgi:hypothetical protein
VLQDQAALQSRLDEAPYDRLLRMMGTVGGTTSAFDFSRPGAAVSRTGFGGFGSSTGSSRNRNSVFGFLV